MGLLPWPVFGRLMRRRVGSGHGGSGINYLLLDQFTTARAAGSVNGTPAEPTGQTRTVTDTNSKLSIAGGVLNFATGGVTNGNPGLWYSSLTRAVGMALITTINYSTLEDLLFGWDTDQTGTPAASAFYSRASALFSYDAATPIAVAVALSTATNYSLAVVLRASGAWLFIKGGAYTNWTLLWATVVQNNGTLYPNISGKVTSVFTADNIRVPVALYIPQPLAYDTFTRSNGALGSTETSGPDSQVLAALAWSTPIGTWAIAANKAGASALAGGLAIATIPTTTKDNFIDAALTRSAGLVGVVGRYADASNYIYAYHDGANAGIKQRLAGVETDIIAATPTAFVASAVMRLMMDTNSCRLFYNNAAVGGAGAINAGLSGTVDGLYTTDTGNTFDGVTIWPRGTGGEYSGLDSY